MLMKDFIPLIPSTEMLEIRSYHPEGTIKVCMASDLSEDDMNLRIYSLHSTIFFNYAINGYSGMFALYVTED